MKKMLAILTICLAMVAVGTACTKTTKVIKPSVIKPSVIKPSVIKPSKTTAMIIKPSVIKPS